MFTAAIPLSFRNCNLAPFVSLLVFLSTISGSVVSADVKVIVSLVVPPTAITPLEAVKPFPANLVAKASIVVFCSVEPSESRVKNASPLSGVTALRPVANRSCDPSNTTDSHPLSTPLFLLV